MESEIWSYLNRGPLFWLILTIAAFFFADQLSKASGRHPLVNPVLISIAIVVSVLASAGIGYGTYFEGAQFIHFLLGPATVALALPLYESRKMISQAAIPVCVALLAGSVTAAVSAVGLGWLLGLDVHYLASLAPKSATAPVAIGIAERFGGLPTLTAVMVILTGMIGAITVTPLMNLLRITDWRARGFAVGVAAHGIGTARAFQVNPTAGAFAALAMGLNAVATSFLAPLVLRLFA